MINKINAKGYVKCWSKQKYEVTWKGYKDLSKSILQTKN